jgi:hypothetical protein
LPVPYDLQKESETAAWQVRSHTMVSFSRLALNYRAAVFCEEALVPGAFVECGAWRGGSMGVMAAANQRHGGAPRDLFLLDSFQDLCEPDEAIDGARAINEARGWGRATGPLTGRLVPMQGFYDGMGGRGTVDDCRALLLGDLGYPAERVHIVEGWFQETIPLCKAQIGPIAILRLDADYYASTKFCLDELYEQVVPGGFVIFDDYGTYEGCRQAVDEFRAHLADKPFQHHIDADGRYWVKHPR